MDILRISVPFPFSTNMNPGMIRLKKKETLLNERVGGRVPVYKAYS